jgi:hypothetical protein
MSASLLERLEWRPAPVEGVVIGYLKDEKNISTFIAEPQGTEFILQGAFVPDLDEHQITYDTLDQAKAAAGLYLCAWMVQRVDEFAQWKDSQMVQSEGALTSYHHMLDRRENANGAAQILVDKIERLLKRPWVQGATIKGEDGA